MNDVTPVLNKIEDGDPTADSQLRPLVFEDLKRLAAIKMANERPGQTLQATALVHDAYLRLVGSSGTQDWNSRGHFFAAAATSMRRILIENARKKHRIRHGGGRKRVDFDVVDRTRPTSLTWTGERLRDTNGTTLEGVHPLNREPTRLDEASLPGFWSITRDSEEYSIPMTMRPIR